MVSNGFHCSDLGTPSGLADPTVGAVQTAALLSMKNWLAGWTPSGNTRHRNTIPGQIEPGVVPENFPSLKPINAFFKSMGSF